MRIWHPCPPPVVIRISEREQTSRMPGHTRDSTQLAPNHPLSSLFFVTSILDTFHSEPAIEIVPPIKWRKPGKHQHLRGLPFFSFLMFFFSILDGEHKPSFGSSAEFPKHPESMTSLGDMGMVWYPGDLVWILAFEVILWRHSLLTCIVLACCSQMNRNCRILEFLSPYIRLLLQLSLVSSSFNSLF